ncbi:hypothetical protein FB567DRAFT_540917 [Paraphoma chrysanthemicola]|uniref:Uncharacterized protein n=1 Tax=Paraphoma chrysanthemicola TaxID=798071 RepID=A0A8K0VSF3_9PLEO|nr:hypothetical protein FB567DRAFT_540917 [Paraphoma chrysanthemicola]
MIGFDIMKAEKKNNKPNDHPKNPTTLDSSTTPTAAQHKPKDEARNSEANQVALLKMQVLMAETHLARQHRDALASQHDKLRAKREADEAQIRRHTADQREKEQVHAQRVLLAQQKAYEIIAEQRKYREERERDAQVMREREEGGVEYRKEVVRLARKKKVEECRREEEERGKVEKVSVELKRLGLVLEEEVGVTEDEKQAVVGMNGKKVRFEVEDAVDRKVESTIEVSELTEPRQIGDDEVKSGSVDEATSDTTAATQTNAQAAAQDSHVLDEESEDEWEAIADDDRKEWEVINVLEEW